MLKKITSFALILPVTAHAIVTQKGIMSLEMKGGLEFQYGATQQEKPFRKVLGDSAGTGPQKSRALVTNGKLSLGAWVSPDADSKYGGFVEFNANPSSAKTGSRSILKKSYIYGQSTWGRIEAGSFSSASGSLKQSPSGIAKATGGASDGDMPYWINTRTIDGFDNDDIFVMTADLPLDHDDSGSANKLTYLTPQYNGLQAGISFIPDGGSKGSIGNTVKQVPHSTDGKKSLYKNIVDLAVVYKYQSAESKWSTSLSGQFGNAKLYSDPTSNQVSRRYPLRAWELGSTLEYQNFALSASYGNWGKSGMFRSTPLGQKRSSSFYTIGVAYTLNKLGASLTYMRSQASGGKLGNALQPKYDVKSTISLGIEYKLISGMLLYAELNKFSLKRGLPGSDSNKGYVTLIGSKLSF